VTFATRHPAPLDALREEATAALEHLDRLRVRVAAGEVDANALAVAELRARHAGARWQEAVRGERPGPGGAS
jgi:hypothetical protein